MNLFINIILHYISRISNKQKSKPRLRYESGGIRYQDIKIRLLQTYKSECSTHIQNEKYMEKFKTWPNEPKYLQTKCLQKPHELQRAFVIIIIYQLLQFASQLEQFKLTM